MFLNPNPVRKRVARVACVLLVALGIGLSAVFPFADSPRTPQTSALSRPASGHVEARPTGAEAVMADVRAMVGVLKTVVAVVLGGWQPIEGVVDWLQSGPRTSRQTSESPGTTDATAAVRRDADPVRRLP